MGIYAKYGNMMDVLKIWKSFGERILICILITLLVVRNIHLSENSKLEEIILYS